MKPDYFRQLIQRNFLFWLSRKIDYPLLPPDLVQVNFSFVCNLRCKMCSMHDQMNLLQQQGKQIEIDSDTLQKVIWETKQLGSSSILFLGGEPLLRKDLFDLIHYAKELELNTMMVSNAVLLTAENIERCLASGLNWLSVSIDAATEEKHRHIRGENVLGKIIENVTRLHVMKQEHSKEFPKVVAVCTIMNDNLEELVDIVNLCRRLHMERIIFQPVVANNIDQTQRTEIFPYERFPVMEKAIDMLIDYKKQSPQNFTFIANGIDHLTVMKRYFKNQVKGLMYPCYAGYNRLQIVQEGKVYFCVNQEKMEASYGDIRQQSLRDLWFSPQARLCRKVIRQCKVPCFQWCSYRDEFIELSDFFEMKRLFTKK